MDWQLWRGGLPAASQVKKRVPINPEKSLYHEGFSNNHIIFYYHPKGEPSSDSNFLFFFACFVLFVVQLRL